MGRKRDGRVKWAGGVHWRSGAHRGNLKGMEQERIVEEAVVKWAWLGRHGKRVWVVGPQRRKAAGMFKSQEYPSLPGSCSYSRHWGYEALIQQTGSYCSVWSQSPLALAWSTWWSPEAETVWARWRYPQSPLIFTEPITFPKTSLLSPWW